MSKKLSTLFIFSLLSISTLFADSTGSNQVFTGNNNSNDPAQKCQKIIMDNKEKLEQLKQEAAGYQNQMIQAQINQNVADLDMIKSKLGDIKSKVDNSLPPECQKFLGFSNPNQMPMGNPNMNSNRNPNRNYQPMSGQNMMMPQMDQECIKFMQENKDKLDGFKKQIEENVSQMFKAQQSGNQTELGDIRKKGLELKKQVENIVPQKCQMMLPFNQGPRNNNMMGNPMPMGNPNMMPMPMKNPNMNPNIPQMPMGKPKLLSEKTRKLLEKKLNELPADKKNELLTKLLDKINKMLDNLSQDTTTPNEQKMKKMGLYMEIKEIIMAKQNQSEEDNLIQDLFSN